MRFVKVAIQVAAACVTAGSAAAFRHDAVGKLKKTAQAFAGDINARAANSGGKAAVRASGRIQLKQGAIAMDVRVNGDVPFADIQRAIQRMDGQALVEQALVEQAVVEQDPTVVVRLAGPDHGSAGRSRQATTGPAAVAPAVATHPLETKCYSGPLQARVVDTSVRAQEIQELRRSQDAAAGKALCAGLHDHPREQLPGADPEGAGDASGGLRRCAYESAGSYGRSSGRVRAGFHRDTRRRLRCRYPSLGM